MSELRKSKCGSEEGGCFGCLIAALNFKNRKDTDERNKR